MRTGAADAMTVPGANQDKMTAKLPEPVRVSLLTTFAGQLQRSDAAQSRPAVIGPARRPRGASDQRRALASAASRARRPGGQRPAAPVPRSGRTAAQRETASGTRRRSTAGLGLSGKCRPQAAGMGSDGVAGQAPRMVEHTPRSGLARPDTQAANRPADAIGGPRPSG